MKAKKYFWVLVLCLAVAACAGQKKPSPGKAGLPEKDHPAPAAQAAAGRAVKKTSAQKTGSLWQGGEGSLFAANKARKVGDLVTVAIYERASAQKEAETETGRASSASLGIPKFFGYEAALAAKNPNLEPASLISASTENSFEGSGSTSREERLSATLTTRVVAVLESGNLKIEGSKTIRVNNEEQIIRLSGIVRPADITESNMIDSKYILDAEIEYFGDGVLSEKQRPGWLARLIDVAWPF